VALGAVGIVAKRAPSVGSGDERGLASSTAAAAAPRSIASSAAAAAAPRSTPPAAAQRPLRGRHQAGTSPYRAACRSPLCRREFYTVRKTVLCRFAPFTAGHVSLWQRKSTRQH
jgi:hypothetical protein